MANINTIIGAPQVIANIKAHHARIAAGCNRGLKLAGLMLQRESQQLVPVEYGPLKASAYTRAVGVGFGTVVYVGFTAAYALYVHEQVAMKLKGQPRTSGVGRYWDPQGRAQAKFLEEPARRFGPTLRKVLIANMKVP